MGEKSIILYDGACNFCDATVNFIISQDKKNVFLFAALLSAPGKVLLEQYNIDWKANDSFVIIENGKAYQKSKAALRLFNKLPWYWKWMQIFRVIPNFIRDGLYDFIAVNRYKWFGKKNECLVPSPQLKARFLT